jgi:hypothetical protein
MTIGQRGRCLHALVLEMAGVLIQGHIQLSGFSRSHASVVKIGRNA